MVFAQEMERSAKPGKRGERGDARANMQERMQKHGAGEGGERLGGREEMVERMLNNPEMREKLGISEENMQKIKEELKKMHEESSQLRAQMEKLGMEQAKAMTSKELDEGRLMSLVEELGKIRTERAKMQMRKMILLRKNIDPEKMDAIRKKAQERMRSRENKSGSENGEGGNGRSRDRVSEDDRARFEQMRKKRQAREKDAERKHANALEVM